MIVPSTQVAVWRRAGSGVLGLAAAFVLVVAAGAEAWKVGIPLMALVGAAVVVWFPALGPQLLARAIWWSNLGLGVALSALGSSHERKCGMAVNVLCSLALLVIGRRGLAEAGERASWVPAAFRSSLLLLMVLALADAQTLGLFATITGDGPPRGLMISAALAFLVGFVGLYRLAVWGAIVNLVAAVFMLLAAVSGALGADHDLHVVIAILMGGQIAAASPMLVALLKGASPPGLPVRTRSLLATVAVIAVMALGLVIGALRSL